MRLLLIPALLVAGGCATPIPASQVSNYELCKYTMAGGSDGPVAQAEATRRGLDCLPYYQAIAAERARSDAALNNAVQYFNRPVQPMPFPQQTNCTSRRVGDTVRTDCW